VRSGRIEKRGLRFVPERVACNLCGASDTRTLYIRKDYRFWVDDADWPVVQCRDCGLGYLNPRPTRAEIDRYYPASYFTNRSNEERYERQAAYLAGPPGWLLDIGAAGGDFLAVMKKRGWEVEGVEPFAQADNPYGIDIHHLSFPNECGLSDQRFDAITAWAVFEHLHDPAKAFSECARLLRSGGRLVIEVPNLQSLRGRLAPMEDVPRHLYFFSPTTLGAYADKSGLRLETVRHVTDLFPDAAGRGVLRYWTARALGKSTEDFFRIYRIPRNERFRRWPVTSAAMTAAGRIGRVLIPDWLARAGRFSAEIVAVFRLAEM
jgi:SAM-dependent methyltransferase